MVRFEIDEDDEIFDVVDGPLILRYKHKLRVPLTIRMLLVHYSSRWQRNPTRGSSSPSAEG